MGFVAYTVKPTTSGRIELKRSVGELEPMGNGGNGGPETEMLGVGHCDVSDSRLELAQGQEPRCHSSS